MQTVNMLEAKSQLSRLVESIELGNTDAIIIARNGRPAAKLVSMQAQRGHVRIGIAKGLFEVPDSIDAHNAQVAELFIGKP